MKTNGRPAAEVTAPPGLQLALHRLELMLRRQVLRLRARHQLVEHEFRGAFISDAQADALLTANGRHSPTEPPPIQALTAQIELLAGTEQLDDASPLNRLARLFHLNPLERDVLLVALAPALDARFEIIYAYAQNDIARKLPTIDLALQLLLANFDERLAAQRHFQWDQPLRRYRLIELAAAPATTLLAQAIKIEPRLVAAALNQAALDERLQFLVEPVAAPAAELPLPPDLRDRLARAADALATGPGLICLHGPPGSGKKEVAATLSERLGRPLLGVDWARAGRSGHPLPDLLAWLNREAIIRSAALYFDADAAPPPEISALETPVFWGVPQPVFQLEQANPYFIFTLPRPDYQQRLALWQQQLAGQPGEAGLSLAEVANKFSLTAGQIRRAAQQAQTELLTRPGEQRQLTGLDLHRAARRCSNQALRELAQRIESPHTWADIKLPPLCERQLREVYLSIKHRSVVLADWGFGQKLVGGKGVNALFFGPSGTGKTMAAGILAHELGLDLYQIDLSTVVSKYIGETEQNLSRIFTAAENSNAILFFDEADALFGKRSEVKDARDRYANIEVAYLLQKMEAYDGIAILATNLPGNMDDAFARRLQHTVEFKQPDARLREQIWRSVFPAQTPLAADLDWAFLAGQFELTGGNIRNVALSAAFLAAEAGRPVSMAMLVTAVARELQKMGKLPTRAAFQHYYADVQQSG